MSFIVTPSTPSTPTVPGGADTQVQYNNAGAFGGIPNVTYNGVSGQLSAISIAGYAANTLSLLGADDAGGGVGGNLVLIAGAANSGSGISGRVSLASGFVSNGILASNVTLTGGTSLVAGVAGGSVVLRPGSGGLGAAASSIRLRDETGANVVQVTGNSTTGTQLGFFAVTPIARPTVAGAAAAFVAGAGVAVQDVSTFDGYTIAQAIKALRNIGLLT